MEQTFTIDTRLCTLNEYTYANRASRRGGATLKREQQRIISWFILSAKLKKMEKPVIVHFHWIEENRRRDIDNVAFAKKFILDALVTHGVILNDSWRYVVGFQDTFEVKSGSAGVRVTLKEVE